MFIFDDGFFVFLRLSHVLLTIAQSVSHVSRMDPYVEANGLRPTAVGDDVDGANDDVDDYEL